MLSSYAKRPDDSPDVELDIFNWDHASRYSKLLPQNKINRVLLTIALIFIVIRELFYSKEKLGRKPKQ